MAGFATMCMVNLDCPDPRALADFYHGVLGWDILAQEDEYAMIGAEGNSPIGFGRVEGYQPPAWPDTSGVKRYHLDFYVDDLDLAANQVVELGGKLADPQPGERWRVMLDPAGHPFCVCLRSS
jgi:predicted enzyme related to lactoylglutathione lyase